MIENNRGQVFSLMKDSHPGARGKGDLAVGFLSTGEKRVPTMAPTEGQRIKPKQEESGGFFGMVMGWLGCHGK
jgi:hypothetical protein